MSASCVLCVLCARRISNLQILRGPQGFESHPRWTTPKVPLLAGTQLGRWDAETTRNRPGPGTELENDADNMVGYRKRLKVCKPSLRGLEFSTHRVSAQNSGVTVCIDEMCSSYPYCSSISFF
jgi:hypothetical protein